MMLLFTNLVENYEKQHWSEFQVGMIYYGLYPFTIILILAGHYLIGTIGKFLNEKVINRKQDERN